jgi:signal peptidase I
MPDAAVRAAPRLLRDVLRRFGFARVRAYGGSMVPAIQPGDLLNVRGAAASEVMPGDVVLFQRGGRLFAHRMVGRTRAGLLRTRGDAHWRAEPAIASSQVLGIVESLNRFKVPGGRFKVPGGRFKVQGAGFKVPVQGSRFTLIVIGLRAWAARTMNLEPEP